MTWPLVAIEATNLTDDRATGVGRYTRQLVEALSTLDVPAPDEFELLQLCKRSRWKLRDRLAQGPRLRAQSWYGAIWPLPRPACKVLHVPDEREPPWNVPVVATVHDLYAALNINYVDESKRQRKLRFYEHLRDRCTRLVCVSENTRQDFLRLVGGDPARLKVVPLGVSPIFRPHSAAEIDALRARLRLDGPYLLFVGATANKNLARVVEAFAAGRFTRDFSLVVAGQQSAEVLASLTSRLATLGLASRVHLAGHVGDADLPALYAGAAAYLFPSLYEGYGLPILEAMASGTPVLASDRGSCPEVAAGQAVIVDPTDVDALAAGIAATLAMPADRRAAALAHARARTWAETARGTLAVWREAMAEA
ncbi:glycosyltransferase family 4 protein [Scleromatobacter humisilvae]|uniref:Glycosyltransferase family 4 protein n=1 Tax=Scleromatobacter humisilvae TaxID=2897159 RepID=A0A9X1YLH3_9BURK|nr:glycosyltransferase family 1 protein [Scleromatobacter humisilvae]MCK9687085.1 glycosyltransferase family 4 protein [Scleromatobacter humisilvae]